MQKEQAPRFGAFLERGKIVAIETDEQENVTGYTVESYDRPGILAKGMNGGTGFSASAGNKVYFYLFDDGTGFILRLI